MVESEFPSRSLTQFAEMHEGMADMYFERSTEQNADDSIDSVRPRRIQGWSQDLMLAASGYVLAASSWSLIDPQRASSIYRKAADIYRGMGHSYWVVMALASGNAREIASIPRWVDEHRNLTHLAVAFGMVSDVVTEEETRSDRSERLATQWRHFGNLPVGRLGIPIDIYGQCALAMRALRNRRDFDFFVRSARTYILRASEIRRTASHDGFHWKRLMSSVLPAEPEAVAMTVLMSMMAVESSQTSLSKLMPDLDHHGRVLVEVGDEIRLAGENDQQFRR